MLFDKQTPRVTRTPTPFQFAIANRIEFLNPSHWDFVTSAASIFLNRRYLGAMQHEFAGEMLRDYGIVYDEAGEPVAAVATQTFNVTGSQLIAANSETQTKLASEVKRKSLSLLKRRIMLCGNVHTWGPHGMAFAAGQDPRRLWPGIAECLYRIRRGNRLHGQTDYVIVKDLFAEDQKHADALQPLRYRSHETEPNMMLSIDKAWSSIDCYVGDLSKRYRAAARKVLKPFANGDLVVAPIADPHAEAEQLYELYRGVATRARVCLFSLSQTTLPRLANSLGEDFVAVGIRQAGKLIGFVTVIRDQQTAVGFYLGMDYQANAELPIYHRLLFAVIEQAIKWQCTHVSFGRTALEAKSRLGCVPETTHVWGRHRVPIINVVIQQILRNVHHDEPPQRNPFKQESNCEAET